MTTLTLPTLDTGADGRARFRDQVLPLTEGSPAARLSALLASGGCQFRHSPVGFRSDFHCTGTPQWLVVLQGRMEIGLQDRAPRSTRRCTATAAASWATSRWSRCSCAPEAQPAAPWPSRRQVSTQCAASAVTQSGSAGTKARP